MHTCYVAVPIDDACAMQVRTEENVCQRWPQRKWSAGYSSSHIFSAISSVPQMSRGMGRRQPAAHPLVNWTSERANIMTTLASLATHKLQVQQTDKWLNYVQCPSTAALLAFLRSIFLVMTAFLYVRHSVTEDLAAASNIPYIHVTGVLFVFHHVFL